jgi:hypothetical protein
MRSRLAGGSVVAVCLVLGVAPAVAQEPEASRPPLGVGFLAIYDRLADSETLDTSLDRLAMSDDGSTIIFTGRGPNGVTIHTVKADGSGLTAIPAPAEIEARGIRSLAIDRDGSRAFLQAQAPYVSQQLYVVQDGAAYLLMDTAGRDDVSTFEQLQTTAEGDMVYFLDQGGGSSDVKALAWDGVEPLMVIDDAKVLSAPARGDKVKSFAVSDAGTTIAFLLDGYFDGDEAYHGADDVYLAADGYTQLTFDPEGSQKERVFLSGDGSTVVFGDVKPNLTWYAMQPAQGGQQTELGGVGFNFGGVDLTRDGGRVLLVDDPTHRGRLVESDGSAHLDLFPAWNVRAITLNATADGAMDDEAEHVAFILQYGSYPTRQAVYVGHLDDPVAVPDAPIIEGPSFLPPDADAADTGVRVLVEARLTDPDNGVARADANGLLNGIIGGSSDLPLYFDGMHDDGAWPDVTASDSVYSGAGREGDGNGDPGATTMRLAAMDPGWTVTVSDWPVETP